VVHLGAPDLVNLADLVNHANLQTPKTSQTEPTNLANLVGLMLYPRGKARALRIVIECGFVAQMSFLWENFRIVDLRKK